jgi:hypothetical protein
MGGERRQDCVASGPADTQFPADIGKGERSDGL